MTATIEQPLGQDQGGDLADFDSVIAATLGTAIDSIDLGGRNGSAFVERVELFSRGARIGELLCRGGGLSRESSSQLEVVMAELGTDPSEDLPFAFGGLFDEMAELIVSARCRNLHAHWLFEADGYLFTRNQGNLLLAMSPREDPSVAVNKSDDDPFFNDLGVIAFPVRPWRLFDLLESGYKRHDALVGVFVCAVVEAYAHESFELYQREPGRPVIDPHDPANDVSAFVTLAGGGRFELTVGQ